MFNRVMKIFSKKVVFDSCGENVVILHGNRFSEPQNMVIGKNVYIGEGNNFISGGGIAIGEGTIIASNNEFRTLDHNWNSEDLKALPFDDRVIAKPIKIGKNVWIGSHCLILPGVEICDGAVIGSGSVLRQSVPQCAVVVGNPATIIKYRNLEKYSLLENSSFMEKLYYEGRNTIKIEKYKKYMIE